MSLREAVPISIGKPCLSISDHSPHLNPLNFPEAREQMHNVKTEEENGGWREGTERVSSNKTFAPCISPRREIWQELHRTTQSFSRRQPLEKGSRETEAKAKLGLGMYSRRERRCQQWLRGAPQNMYDLLAQKDF